MRTSLKSSLIALAAFAAIGTTAASAATIAGRITAVDMAAHRLVLRHHAYHLSKALKINGLRKGESVRLTYHRSHGKRWVTAFKPVMHHAGSAAHKSMQTQTKTY